MSFKECPIKNGVESLWWTSYFLNTCTYSWVETISKISGICSVGLWFTAMLPQIFKNWSRKSASGLSAYLIIFWLSGDLMNFLGCVILRQQLFQKFLASYYITTDFILLSQYLYYQNRHEKPTQLISPRESDALLPSQLTDATLSDIPENQMVIRRKLSVPTYSIMDFHMGYKYTGVIALFLVLLIGRAVFKSIEFELETVGLTMGWLCGIFYHIAMIPQLWHNWKRRSVEGLSLPMFIIIFSANTTYALSLISLATVSDSTFLHRTFPFIYGAVVSMFLDILVFLQFYFLPSSSETIFPITQAPACDLQV